MSAEWDILGGGTNTVAYSFPNALRCVCQNTCKILVTMKLYSYGRHKCTFENLKNRKNIFETVNWSQTVLGCY